MGILCGKTVYHLTDCEFLGATGKSICACLKGIAHGTAMSMVGKFRSIFACLGMEGPWNTTTETGNPGSHKFILVHIRALKRKQSLSHVLPKQATPILIDKLQVAICLGE